MLEGPCADWHEPDTLPAFCCRVGTPQRLAERNSNLSDQASLRRRPCGRSIRFPWPPVGSITSEKGMDQQALDRNQASEVGKTCTGAGYGLSAAWQERNANPAEFRIPAVFYWHPEDWKPACQRCSLVLVMGFRLAAALKVLETGGGSSSPMRSPPSVNIARLTYLLVCECAGVAVALSTKGTIFEVQLWMGMLGGLLKG